MYISDFSFIWYFNTSYYVFFFFSTNPLIYLCSDRNFFKWDLPNNDHTYIYILYIIYVYILSVQACYYYYLGLNYSLTAAIILLKRRILFLSAKLYIGMWKKKILSVIVMQLTLPSWSCQNRNVPIYNLEDFIYFYLYIHAQ